jgi:hypothetical protein
MSILRYSRERLQAAHAEAERLRDLDFPYAHAEDGLVVICQKLKERIEVLETLSENSDPTVIRAACSETLLRIDQSLRLLGFILRSTDTRNSFEVCGPLLRLARQVLDNDTKLIVSSEWILSPHVFPMQVLPGFVLMGLPASESDNPLLTPLAGHELGHTVWQKESLENEFARRIRLALDSAAKSRAADYKHIFGDELGSLYFPDNIAPAYIAALKQAEESFCDFLGIRLFSEAYLHAFAYLLAPGHQGPRSPSYPNMRRRIANMALAASTLGVVVPTEFETWFADGQEPVDPKSKFLVALADEAAQGLVPDLIATARQISDRRSISVRKQEQIAMALTAFQMLTPACGIGDLTSLMNAGWQAYHDETVFRELNPSERHDVLRELLLKSVEILEIETLTQGTGT